MFQWREVDQEEQLVAEEAFPLNTVYFPMRMYILRSLKMDQLIKMSFESLEAARDIRSAQIQPKQLDINVGNLKFRSVKFNFDGYCCIVGTRRAIEGKYVNEKVFATKMFSGELLDECTTDEKNMYVIVPGEGDLLDGVWNVYNFLCSLFQEAVTTNLVVSGEFAYLYPVLNSIREFKSFNDVELCGHWGSEEHLKEVFENILEKTTFKNLAIHDEPPVGSKPVKITADHLLFNLHDPGWLSEPRFMEIDAKKITLQNVGSSTSFAERFNLALKMWNEGTGLRRLESITCFNFNSGQLGIVKERLPMRQRNKFTRPSCYYVYNIGEDEQKRFFDYYDLRNAEDLTNYGDGLGTIFTAQRVLKFLVWSQKEVGSVREAYGKIEQVRQKYSDEKAVISRRLENLYAMKTVYEPELLQAQLEKRPVSFDRQRQIYGNEQLIWNEQKKLWATKRMIEDCERFKRIIEKQSA